jgi:hypothetical protein
MSSGQTVLPKPEPHLICPRPHGPARFRLACLFGKVRLNSPLDSPYLAHARSGTRIKRPVRAILVACHLSRLLVVTLVLTFPILAPALGSDNEQLEQQPEQARTQCTA